MNKNKGITLVALVVTIIVLIILAGVSISLVLGQNGIVQKAKQGRDNYAEAAIIENEQLANVDAFAMNIEGITSTSNKDIHDIPVTPEIPETPEIKYNATQIKANPSQYYGKTVNYSANGVDEWQIFYTDNNNIFLIKKDFLDLSKVTLTNARFDQI